MIRKIKYGIKYALGYCFPRLLADIKFKQYFGRKINWKDPKDHNEKIQWLKFYSDTSEWPRLADKYRVREYVESCGLKDMLIPLYGVYDRAGQIDFDRLPDSFIIKTNHGCDTNIFVRDKSKLDRNEAVRKLNDWLKKRYGIMTAEPHYRKIKPRIIIEKLMVNDADFSTSLIDYKFHCTDGVVRFLEVHYDRNGKDSKVMLYDASFRPLDQFLSKESVVDASKVRKPQAWDRMIEACRVLGKQFPLVRIDFYEVGGKAWFGEMTFTNASGLDSDFTQEYRDLLGSYVHLRKK